MVNILWPCDTNIYAIYQWIKSFVKKSTVVLCACPFVLCTFMWITILVLVGGIGLFSSIFHYRCYSMFKETTNEFSTNLMSFDESNNFRIRITLNDGKKSSSLSPLILRQKKHCFKKSSIKFFAYEDLCFTRFFFELKNFTFSNFSSSQSDITGLLEVIKPAKTLKLSFLVQKIATEDVSTSQECVNDKKGLSKQGTCYSKQFIDSFVIVIRNETHVELITEEPKDKNLQEDHRTTYKYIPYSSNSLVVSGITGFVYFANMDPFYDWQEIGKGSLIKDYEFGFSTIARCKMLGVNAIFIFDLLSMIYKISLVFTLPLVCIFCCCCFVISDAVICFSCCSVEIGCVGCDFFKYVVGRICYNILCCWCVMRRRRKRKRIKRILKAWKKHKKTRKRRDLAYNQGKYIMELKERIKSGEHLQPVQATRGHKEIDEMDEDDMIREIISSRDILDDGKDEVEVEIIKKSDTPRESTSTAPKIIKKGKKKKPRKRKKSKKNQKKKYEKGSTSSDFSTESGSKEESEAAATDDTESAKEEFSEEEEEADLKSSDIGVQLQKKHSLSIDFHRTSTELGSTEIQEELDKEEISRNPVKMEVVDMRPSEIKQVSKNHIDFELAPFESASASIRRYLKEVNDPSQIEWMFINSIKNGKLSILKKIVGTIGNELIFCGMTGLHVAVIENKMEIIKYFIEELKTNINTLDPVGNSLLHLAVIFDCSRQVISYLIEIGFDLDVINLESKSALDCTQDVDLQDFLIMLINKKRTIENIKKFCCTKNTQDLESLENIDLKEFQIHLSCPITGRVMEDPYILVESGVSYEKEEILNWLKVNSTDPVTGIEIETKELKEDTDLKFAIGLWKNKMID